MSHPDRAVQAVAADGLMTEHLLLVLPPATAPEKCPSRGDSWRHTVSVLAVRVTGLQKFKNFEAKERETSSCVSFPAATAIECQVPSRGFPVQKYFPGCLAQAHDIDQLLESVTPIILLDRN